MSEAGGTPPIIQNTFDARLAYVQSNIRPPSRERPYPYPADQASNQVQDGQRHLRAPRPGHTHHPSTSSAPLLRSSSSLARPGCVLCGLVRSCQETHPSSALYPTDPYTSNSQTPVTGSTAASGQGTGHSASPYYHPFDSRSASPVPVSREGRQGNRVGGREIIYHDGQITVYRAEGRERLCDGGRHIIVVINIHAQSVYEFGPSDIPLLSHILETATQILFSAAAASDNDAERGQDKEEVQIGFVGSLIRDPESPYPHLHAHAYLPPINTKLAGASLWRRNVIFGSLNWWSITDLRAEIREESSNNRVKTGYKHRDAPIDKIPDAGSVVAPANAFVEARYSDSPSPSLTAQSSPKNQPSHRSQNRLSAPANSHPLSRISSAPSDLSLSTITPETWSYGGNHEATEVQGGRLREGVV